MGSSLLLRGFKALLVIVTVQPGLRASFRSGLLMMQLQKWILEEFKVTHIINCRALVLSAKMGLAQSID